MTATTKFPYAMRKKAETVYNRWLKAIYPDLVQIVRALPRDPRLERVHPVANPRILVVQKEAMPGWTGFAFTRGMNGDESVWGDLKRAFPFWNPADCLNNFKSKIVISSVILESSILVQKLSVIHEGLHMAGAIGHGWHFKGRNLFDGGWVWNYHNVSMYLYETEFAERMG